MPESSEEIKRQIYQQTQNLPEGATPDEELIEYEIPHEALGEGEEEEVTSQPEEDILSQPHDDPVDEYIRQQKLKKDARRRFDQMDSQEQFEYVRAYGKPPERVEPTLTQEQVGHQVVNAFASDFLELRDRYGSDLVDRFGADFKIGKVKIPRGIERQENPHEALFLDWIGRSGTFNKMNYREQREFLKNTEGPPLKSRSRDLIQPEHKRPTPKPRKPRKPEPKYRMKDVGDRMRHLMEEDMKAHPDYYWERVDE